MWSFLTHVLKQSSKFKVSVTISIYIFLINPLSLQLLSFSAAIFLWSSQSTLDFLLNFIFVKIIYLSYDSICFQVNISLHHDQHFLSQRCFIKWLFKFIIYIYFNLNYVLSLYTCIFLYPTLLTEIGTSSTVLFFFTDNDLWFVFFFLKFNHIPFFVYLMDFYLYIRL